LEQEKYHNITRIKGMTDNDKGMKNSDKGMKKHKDRLMSKQEFN
jgi:hypothetical protein